MTNTTNPVNRVLWLASKASHQPIIEEIDATTEALVAWVYENVVGHDCLPRELPPELAGLAARLRAANAAHRAIVEETADFEAMLFYKGMGVKALGVEPVLTLEEFYLFRARGLIDYPGDPEYSTYLAQHRPAPPQE
ncbi:MAG: hypothetical protein FJ102_19525 [Deltaproteobacteria bacterium]|nr:hypothetical protein [Deltaproteobacteria bacterium]